MTGVKPTVEPKLRITRKETDNQKIAFEESTRPLEPEEGLYPDSEGVRHWLEGIRCHMFCFKKIGDSRGRQGKKEGLGLGHWVQSERWYDIAQNCTGAGAKGSWKTDQVVGHEAEGIGIKLDPSSPSQIYPIKESKALGTNEGLGGGIN